MYNSKTRKLGCYQAQDIGGLSIKGSTVLNYIESKSVQKKLRKPEQIVPEVIGTNFDGTLSLDYPKLTALIVESIKEIITRLEALESKINQ